MDILKITNHMKQAGVCFSSGLTNETVVQIEEIYEIRFPDSLKAFYSIALPISAGDIKFPEWNDFSPKNISYIRQLIKAPYQWLKQDIERGFWLSSWDGKTIDELFANAPKLIPIYLHRYVPMLNYANPPVISTVGRDTVCYGVSLENYLLREFCNGGTAFEKIKVPYIPLWSDLITNINYPIVSIMLENLSKYSDLTQDSYAIAIYTDKGKVYTYKAEINIEAENERIYRDIKSNLKDSIHYIVCVRGKKMTVDIPPYHLRKKLCEINEENYEAEIIMQGMNEYHLKKMWDTLL